MGKKETKSIPLQDQIKTKQSSRKRPRTKSLTDVIVTNHLKFNKPVTDDTQGKVKKKKEALEEMVHKSKHRTAKTDKKVTEGKAEALRYHLYKADRISEETEYQFHNKYITEDENKDCYIENDKKHNDTNHTHENIGGGGGENEKENESCKDEKLEQKYDFSGDKGSKKEQMLVKDEMKSSAEEILNNLMCKLDEHVLDDLGDLVDGDLDIDVSYLGGHYKKVTNNTDETGNKLDVSKMSKMQGEKGDCEKDTKNGKDVNNRKADKSGKEAKNWKTVQNINSLQDTDKNEKPIKQTVDLPDDNRYRKPDNPEQEETKVKTVGTLLVLDANKETEKEDDSEEKTDQPKNWLENSTSSCDNQCRSSLDEQEDENCRSFQSEDSVEQEGEENSCSFSEDYFSSYLHSYAGSEYAESMSSQSAPPLGNKSDALWKKTQEVVTWASVVKDDAQSSDEEKRDGLAFTSLRVTELQDEMDVTAEEISEGGELVDGDAIEELSEKEKMLLDEEKDECQEFDTDATQADENDEVEAEQKGTETTGEEFPVDICTSLVPAMKSDIKEETENGSAAIEGFEIIQDTEYKTENETVNICTIACKQCGLPGSFTFLLCKITVETPLQKKLLGSCPFESYAKEKPTSQNSLNKQKSDSGHLSSRSKFTKGKRRRNAYVKHPKRFIKDKPACCGTSGSRRLPWLRGAGTCGRRCSDSSGGSAGGSYHHNSGGSDEKGDHEGPGRRDRNNNGHRNNNYNDGRNNSGDRNGSGDGNGSRKRPSWSNPEKETSNIPDQDFKRYRKKHTGITLDDFMSFLGQHRTLIEEIKGPVWEEIDNPISDCLSLSLEKPDEVSEELLNCDVCSIINSMMKHFADCEKQYVVCTMCIQMFSFICIHAYNCKKNGYRCEIALCVKFYQVLGEDTIHGRMKCLWFNIKKKLARVLGFDDGVMTSTSAVPVNPPNLPSIGGARSYNPSLASIPENTEGSSSRSGSRVLARKRSNKLPSVHETESLPPDRPVSGELTNSSGEAAVAECAPQQPAIDLVYHRTPPRKISSSRLFSLPVTGGVEGHYGQYPSFTDKPVGTPGICEVMYGNIQQLVVVGKNWSELKAMFQRDEPLPRPYREEGIILRPFQECLLITGLRYQINFQWLKVSHLGNGMSGKCHLATDFQTDFKFCVKEIHINNFEVEEIELWSDLEHPYIVKLYGAIRHGEMIYIFSEFIDGGNLTEAINTQRALNKRLSHTTALMLFKQLLEVLVYLKEKHILHEDLKADNILLHREKDSISIKVTDFGSATRINATVRVGTKPVGTMTQWSPEKAECVGYGYPAEVWAAVCVLVHMVSGLPPWMRRYGGLKSLIVVIVQQSPPVEDIPRNIPKCVRDLIERGFTVCQGQRPTPEDLLRHEAFKLITNTRPRSDAYSILDSTFHLDNTELEHKNEDLQEIIKSLDKRKKSAVRMPEPIDRLTSGLNNISFQGPGQVPHSTVAVIHGVERQPQQNTSADNDETVGRNRGEGQVGGEGQTACGPPSDQEVGSQLPAQNENPLRHYLNYIVDDVNINSADPTVVPYQGVVPYQPGNKTQIEEIRVAIETQELENQALNTHLPNFEKILESSSGLSDDYDDMDDKDKDEPEAPFDFKSGHEKIVGKYLSPLPQDGIDPMIGATRIPLTVQSTESPDTESTLQEETRLSPTSKSSDSKTPKTDSSKLSDMDNRLPSGDDLFKSGPGDDLEILQGIQNLSVTLRVPGPSVNTIESPITGDERALFGNGSLGNTNTQDGQTTEQPVFPPMCSPSRNVDLLYSRPGVVAGRHFNSPQPNAAQNPLLTTLSDYGLSTMNKNSNANPFHPELQRTPDNPANRLTSAPTRNIVSEERHPSQMLFTERQYNNPPRTISETPVAAPKRSRLSQYPYSNTRQRDVMKPENPGVEGPPATFVLGSQSGTSSSSSSGSLLSPVPQAKGPNNPDLQSGRDAQTSSAVPHTQLGRNSEMSSLANSFATSTPVSIPKKGKQEKDAMNEMLKSFKVTQVESNPRQVDQSSQPPSSGSSPLQQSRQTLRLDVTGPRQPTETVLHVQSAPTLQRTPSYPADHHRVSGVPHSATPPKGTTQWPTEGPGSASASTSTSRSQFEEQEQAFAELERDISQHSHSESHLHLSLLEGDEENPEDIEPREDSITSEEAAREAIMQQYITEDEERKVTVSFVCVNENSPIKMKFTNSGRLWRQILQQDLCRSGIHTLFGCENFCLKFEDGTAVDLDMQLGDNDVTVTVVTASEDDPWCIEGGQLFFT